MEETEGSLAKNRRTIASYERYADCYEAKVRHVPRPQDDAALRQVASIAGPCGRVLEIGSGPGYDADFLEALGVDVRRTDAALRFLELQAERGKHGERLDILTDVLGGPYDAVVAQYVLFHIPRDSMSHVLAKIASALRPGGGFLVSMPEGDGEAEGDYHTVSWRRDDFAACLTDAGLTLLWDEPRAGSSRDKWIIFLARRMA